MDYDIIDMIWTMISYSTQWYHISYHNNHIYDIIYDIDYDLEYDIIIQTYDIIIHELPMIS